MGDRVINIVILCARTELTVSSILSRFPFAEDADRVAHGFSVSDSPSDM